jgi:osmoprotectant transport system ATP-binding protein
VTESQAVIRLEGVSKSYRGRVALAPTTLEVRRGECLVLVGPSGCGKSTLLRLVIGLIAPDSGTVWFDGAPVQPSAWADLRRRVGYVIQEGGLFPHLTASGNAALKARDLGWGEDRVNARLAELARLVGLSDELLRLYPAQLSGGQRQRVSLMRALMLEPEALLMDEPLAALDPMIRARLQADLKAIFRRLRMTVLFVTHDLAEAEALGDRIAMMRAGRIVQSGTFADLRDRPADPFVTEFLSAQRFAPAGVTGT